MNRTGTLLFLNNNETDLIAVFYREDGSADTLNVTGRGHTTHITASWGFSRDVDFLDESNLGLRFSVSLFNNSTVSLLKPYPVVTHVPGVRVESIRIYVTRAGNGEISGPVLSIEELLFTGHRVSGGIAIASVHPNAQLQGHIEIPSRKFGLPVVQIGARAFEGQTELTSITIPAGVREIGAGAFAFTGLTHVTIPSSVEHIGTNAFPFSAAITWNYNPSLSGCAAFRQSLAEVSLIM